MKKIIGVFVILILVTGCGTKKEETNEFDEQKLKDKLIEYAKSVYESDSFPNKEPSENVYLLDYISVELRHDREVILAAVTHYGSALEFASKELRQDREVVLAAVVNNGRALQWASKHL